VTVTNGTLIPTLAFDPGINHGIAAGHATVGIHLVQAILQGCAYRSIILGTDFGAWIFALIERCCRGGSVRIGSGAGGHQAQVYDRDVFAKTLHLKHSFEKKLNLTSSTTMAELLPILKLNNQYSN
jgi:hypothetical protein